VDRDSFPGRREAIALRNPALRKLNAADPGRSFAAMRRTRGSCGKRVHAFHASQNECSASLMCA
jgi:hypothetical protein